MIHLLNTFIVRLRKARMSSSKLPEPVANCTGRIARRKRKARGSFYPQMHVCCILLLQQDFAANFFSFRGRTHSHRPHISLRRRLLLNKRSLVTSHCAQKLLIEHSHIHRWCLDLVIKPLCDYSIILSRHRVRLKTTSKGRFEGRRFKRVEKYILGLVYENDSHLRPFPTDLYFD